MQYSVDTYESFNDVFSLLKRGDMSIISITNNILEVEIEEEKHELEVDEKYLDKLSSFKKSDIDDVIFGKDKTSNIVNISVKNDVVYTFQEIDGQVIKSEAPYKKWALSNKLMPGFTLLKGSQHYNCRRDFSVDEWQAYRKQYFYKADHYTIWNDVENHMVSKGATYFKGLHPKDVGVLSFDIESTGLVHDKNSRVLLISNTFRRKDVLIKKLFAYDDYTSDADMFDAWCEWVRDVNPSVLLGHNIFGFDLPYMNYCAEKAGTQLYLGRDDSEIQFNEKPSAKRVDGSLDINYFNASIFGRDVVDTMFLAITYDFKKRYTNYGLKTIIKEENLEKVGRTFYEAEQIRYKYNIPEEWIKIKAYAMDDADDALSLFDLMISSYFYFTQSVGKTFQQMVNSATGSQINNMMVRAYLQDGRAVAKATELTEKVQGATSFAVPKIYRNLLKVDLKSCYPSQILRFQLYDKEKDPEQYFYKMTKHFTYARFDLQKKHKETGERSYYEREQSGKIFINSAYGLTNTPGLNYNSPIIAAKITSESRKIIDFALKWASGNGTDYWIALFEEKTKKKTKKKVINEVI